MSDRPDVLPLSIEEAPDISDALIITTVLMRAVAEWQADISRASLACASAADRGDLDAVADACRAFASVRPAVDRMPAISRACIAAYEDLGAQHPLPDPSMDARTRRALAKVAPWMEKRWLRMYGPKPATAAAPARSAPLLKATRKACRRNMRERLALTDSELLKLSADARPAAHAARLIMVSDRNDKARACRDCGDCRLATDPITEPLPTS